MNEEHHPWTIFPHTKTGKKLILGSFPPKRFTTKPPNLIKSDINFFYGSVDNEFWKMFCISKCLDFDWRLNLEKLKSFLTANDWMISDIILKTSRKKDSALDKDLLVTRWNVKVIKELIENNEIEKIYFTSKWVQERFCEKIVPHLNEIPKFAILISPSKNGLMSLNWARQTLKQLPSESNKDYRQRYYNNFLI